MRAPRSFIVATFGVILLGVIGCNSRQPAAPEPVAPELEMTPFPTVPPRTPTPIGEAPPPKPRPVETGELSGPDISYFGVARADGLPVEPTSVDKNGVPTYNAMVGSGFIMVVEAKPGASGADVSRQVYIHSETDPTLRPDLEIQATRDLGNGSKAVCDRRRPNMGGIPAINPPSFKETQAVADTLNDFSCRFETFVESDSSCTLDKMGNFSFASPDTTAQFCVMVARSFAFPEGTTEVRARVRDVAGRPGPVKMIKIFRPKAPKN